MSDHLCQSAVSWFFFRRGNCAPVKTSRSLGGWRYNILFQLCAAFVNLQFHLTGALTAVGALMTLIDFTLSNARRFYSSMGNRLAVKGLIKEICEVIVVE